MLYEILKFEPLAKSDKTRTASELLISFLSKRVRYGEVGIYVFEDLRALDDIISDFEVSL